jgi:hypothetical protein
MPLSGAVTIDGRTFSVKTIHDPRRDTWHAAVGEGASPARWSRLPLAYDGEGEAFAAAAGAAARLCAGGPFGPRGYPGAHGPEPPADPLAWDDPLRSVFDLLDGAVRAVAAARAALDAPGLAPLRLIARMAEAPRLLRRRSRPPTCHRGLRGPSHRVPAASNTSGGIASSGPNSS